MVQDSYAKYVSSASASSNISIAGWAFKVNNQDVLSNNNFSNTIVPIFSNNSYVKYGYIAPNSEGYFDIRIDSTYVDVTYSETITLSLANSNTVTDLKITGYSLNSGSVVQFGNNNTVITSNHALNEQNTINTYRVYVKWLEGTGETMDNEDDTDASQDGVAAINVTIDFLQTTAAPSSQPAVPSPSSMPESSEP